MDVIYKDENLLAINKPAGLLSIPDGYNKGLPNLKNILENEFPRVWTVHRLDKDTSGIILFALTPDAHKNLSCQFQNRQIEKIYIALVMGVVDDDDLVIDVPLKINADRKHRTVPDYNQGKPALTLVQVITRNKTNTLVKAEPKTGYLHQIRSHLLYIGHPVLNDSLYTVKKPHSTPLLGSGRLMLHALQITFRHPASGSLVTLKTELPPEFLTT